jgi:thiamine pyrophosphate-dependent acetolactate synthase large subunit-like protein
MFQRDYIMRAVQQAAEALARALRLAMQKEPEQAEQALGEGYAALGIDRELLLVLDAATLTRQLGDDEKIEMAVRLLLGEAEVALAKGAATVVASRARAARRLADQLHALPEALQAELERMSTF